jgi:hypothetical protein
MRSTATNLGGFVADEPVEPVTKKLKNSMTQTIIVTPAKKLLAWPSETPGRPPFASTALGTTRAQIET